MKLVCLPDTDGNHITLRPTKIVAVGLNYRDHVAESLAFNPLELGLPRWPVLFSKAPNVLIGPGESIVLPAQPILEGVKEPRTDYEAELACVIGRSGRNWKPSEALEAIAYYTCFNDVTQRDIQKADASGWFRGKSFDTFGPIGPLLVPRSKLGTASDLGIFARVNGKTVQSARTSLMIFPPQVLVAYISRQMTLEEGDIIITGTPGGIGPLHPGDVVEVEVEGIGVLRNPVVAESVPDGDNFDFYEGALGQG